VATLLLIVGVACVGATAETEAWWWGVPGYLCLLFVPALIFDSVVDELDRRRMSLEVAESYDVTEP
jgi:hypothetical protein